MASSDNQGLQIALIVFVILTIILSVTTFFYSRQADTAFQQSEKDRADKTKADADLRTAVAEIEELKRLMGFEPTVKLDELTETFTQDMQTFAGTFPPEKQFYRPAFEYLVTSLREAQSNLAEVKEINASLEARNEEREQQKEEQLEIFRGRIRDLERDLATAKAAFDEERDRIVEDQRQLASRLQKSENELNAAREEHARRSQQLTSEIERLRLQLSDTQEKLAALTDETFSTPDGRIVSINQHSGTVWIDLGHEHGLKRQTTFSVFGADENNVNRVKRKGSIEVTQVLGSQMAEARILDDQIDDPILPGDKVYTPLWHPGRPQRFALAGWMDLDGDDRSDRQMIRDLIAMHGGVIDAEVLDDGTRTGELSLNTRFLVVGEERESINAELGKIQADAISLGIERITLDKFLDHVGWKDTKRVLRFGNSPPLDFLPEPPDGGFPSSSGNVSERFKKRPPRTRPDSAY